MVLGIVIGVWILSAIFLVVWLAHDMRKRETNLSDTYRNGTKLDSWTPIDKWEDIMGKSIKASRERRVNGKK